MNHFKSFLIIILCCFIIYTKRDYVNSFYKKDEPVLKNLNVLNDNYLPEYIEIDNDIKSDTLYKILILGNSLSVHAISDKVGWKKVSGMAATSIENDYVHILSKKLTKLNIKCVIRVSNIANWERTLDISKINGLTDLVNYKPDLVIYQIGENVPLDSLSQFSNKFIDIVRPFNNSKKIFTNPFNPDFKKNNIAKNMSINHNGYLVDLSSLQLDRENIAFNDPIYNGFHWKNTDVSLHPGDKGMESISDLYFIAVKNLLFK